MPPVGDAAVVAEEEVGVVDVVALVVEEGVAVEDVVGFQAEEGVAHQVAVVEDDLEAVVDSHLDEEEGEDGNRPSHHWNHFTKSIHLY